MSSEVIIRPFRVDDSIEAMKMCHELHECSSMADLPFCEDRIRDLFVRSLTMPCRYLFLVAQRGDELIGSFYGALIPYYFNNEFMGQEYWVYVREQHRGTHAGTSFVKRFDEWVERHGALETCIAPSTGIQTARTERWLNNIGFSTTGVITKRRIR